MVINGGAGMDTVIMQDTAPLLLNMGANSIERVYGNAGADQIDASALGQGAVVYGGAGADVIIGSFYNDELNGDAGDDFILGGAGGDEITGGTGADWLFGGDGDDTLNGGIGSDVLDGGNGNDIYQLDRGYGADTIIEIDSTTSNDNRPDLARSGRQQPPGRRDRDR